MNLAIKAEKLTKKYKDFIAVNQISFEVFEGEFFGFVGPNGAGKSTTISMLSTILEPTSGKISVAGFDVLKQKNQVRNSIGIIFQETSLDIDLTAWENLWFHAKIYGLEKKLFESRAHELLELVQMSERKDSLVRTFSGGMKRRIEIVRGLLHHPKVLFLDEPTIGLDPQTRSLIWKYLNDLQKREAITIFLTTHYLPETENCNRVAIMNQGEILALGTPSELKKKYNQDSMDKVFIEATGHGIADEELSDDDQARMRFKQRGGRF